MSKNDLTASYAGITLKNPIVVASSGHTHSVASIKKLASAGAGAVVLKSLFEEQIEGLSDKYAAEQDHTEALDYVRQYVKGNELNKHIDLVYEAKKEVDIPIIASINCYKSGQWTDFAKQLAQAGADAIEVNIMRLETDINTDPNSVIRNYTAIAKAVSEEVNIPVAVKLAKSFSTLVSLVDKMAVSGIKGVTLFNRSFQMDVDIEKETITSGSLFTRSEDLAETLRYTGLITTKVPKIEVSASTGIHTASDAIKALLVGASSVQLCSTLYINGIDTIPTIIEGIDQWMTNKKYYRIEEFRGRLKANEDATIYSRMQFMKYFSNNKQ